MFDIMPKHHNMKKIASESLTPIRQPLAIAFELMDRADFSFHYRLALLIQVATDLMERIRVLKDPHIFLKCKYLQEKCLPQIQQSGHWNRELKKEVLDILCFIDNKITDNYVEVVVIDHPTSSTHKNTKAFSYHRENQSNITFDQNPTLF